jgi:hypothetical protein
LAEGGRPKSVLIPHLIGKSGGEMRGLFEQVEIVL